MHLWWESIHGFNGFLWPFRRNLGDVFKKGKSWPVSTFKSAVDCRRQHFCLHQKNEKFSAYKTGQRSQYGSEAWLTSIPWMGEKKWVQRQSESFPCFLWSQTWRQIRKYRRKKRLKEKGRCKKRHSMFWVFFFFLEACTFKLTKKDGEINLTKGETSLFLTVLSVQHWVLHCFESTPDCLTTVVSYSYAMWERKKVIKMCFKD